MKHVRRRDIDKLSQGELLEAVKRSSLEKAIDTRTGPIALVLTFLFVASLYGIGIHDIAILVFAFFMGGLYIMLSINTLVDFRTRHFRRELLWRLGYRDTKRVEREAAAAFDASDGPDWFVIFQGKALPHGGIVDLVAEIRPASPDGRITQRRCSFPDFGEVPPFTSESVDHVLTPDQCSALLTDLAAFDAAKPGGSRWTVIDGFACTLTVMRRKPRACKRFEFNLSDRSGTGEQFGRNLATALLDMTRGLTETPMIVGSCDTYGNIEIDGV